MPDNASMPTQPSATARADSVVPGLARGDPDRGPAAAVGRLDLMPLVAIRTTVPAKPSSLTSRLDPPATSSSGSSASSTSRTASTSSSVGGRP